MSPKLFMSCIVQKCHWSVWRNGTCIKEWVAYKTQRQHCMEVTDTTNCQMILDCKPSHKHFKADPWPEISSYKPLMEPFWALHNNRYTIISVQDCMTSEVSILGHGHICFKDQRPEETSATNVTRIATWLILKTINITILINIMILKILLKISNPQT